MSGLGLHDGYVITAAILLVTCLLWYLLGPELAIICGGTIALGTVLNRTQSPKPKRVRSRKTRPLSPSSLSRLVSEGVTVRKKPAYTRRDVVVIPDSPVSFQPHRKPISRRLAAAQRSLNFEGET